MNTGDVKRLKVEVFSTTNLGFQPELTRKKRNNYRLAVEENAMFVEEREQHKETPSRWEKRCKQHTPSLPP